MISVKTASGADNVTISSDEYNSMKSQISSLQDEVTKLNSYINTFEETITTNGWEIGAFTASGADYEGSTSRFRYSTPIKISDFISFTYNYTDWYIRYYYFDSGQTFLSDTGWINGEESQYTEDTVFPENAVYFKLLARKHDNTNVSLSDLVDFNPVIILRKNPEEEMVYSQKYAPSKWQNIAYSSFGSYAGNSTEFFKNNSKYKFDMLKCDVQPTSDGKLVLCHDDGFTLNTDGRIISYDADDNTLIRSMTYEMAMSYQYARQVDGQYCSVCDIDTFLEICKSSGIPPFITVRDQYMDEVASALAESLTKYGLTDVTVINSSTRASLSTVRNYMPNVTVCVFLQSVWQLYGSCL